LGTDKEINEGNESDLKHETRELLAKANSDHKACKTGEGLIATLSRDIYLKERSGFRENALADRSFCNDLSATVGYP